MSAMHNNEMYKIFHTFPNQDSLSSTLTATPLQNNDRMTKCEWHSDEPPLSLIYVKRPRNNLRSRVDVTVTSLYTRASEFYANAKARVRVRN